MLGAATQSLRTCVLRPSTIIGPGDTTSLPSFYNCIAKSETPYRLGPGDNLYDFTYVDNVADAHALAAEVLLSSESEHVSGEAFFITNGEPVPFRAFCLAVWAHFGHVPTYEVAIPEGFAWLMGCLAEAATWVTGSPTTLSRGSVRDASGMRYANIGKAARLLGYRPRVGLVEGLRRSCEVCDANPSSGRETNVLRLWQKAYKEQLGINRAASKP